jgi:hypothetical protein
VTITLPPQLESALAARATERGIAPEELAVELLSAYFPPDPPPIPHDEFVRLLQSAATDCGVSLSNEALSSDGLYD